MRGPWRVAKVRLTATTWAVIRSQTMPRQWQVLLSDHEETYSKGVENCDTNLSRKAPS